MWIVHIDTWNYADPQKIIDLIPEDLLPYVVFNISLSIGTDDDGNFVRSGDGYETAKSWLRVCAQNQVWAMVQPASGGPTHYEDLDPRYDDYENTLYTEFFEEYPNFLGFNYCEQFWGFDQEGLSPSAKERWTHFAGLLELANKYGGYLVVSWCGNKWSPNINPLAMLKQVPVFEEACSKYSENFILCEKYTQHSYIMDMESLVYGFYLSGYAGNVGVRYDESGWTDGDDYDDNSEYRVSTGLAVQLERMLLNGYTVIDGPELIWADDFKEISAGKDSQGYSTRRWDTYDQFENVAVDMFRKVIEGELRIPTRAEVIARTKIAILQDVNSGSNDNKYSTYQTLFEGVYQQEDDGALSENHSFYKSTGRYPTIPTIYALNDKLSENLTVIKQSSLSSRWGSISKKLEELNKLFAKEYSGDLYAGRYENTWVVYNPYKTETAAVSTLSLKYNTCKSLTVSMSRYSSGIITEYSDHINIYLNNYDEDAKSTLRTDIIKVSGASSQPTVTYTVRGEGTATPSVATSWQNGVLTVTVKHNGPLDIQIKCKGSETDRLSSYTAVKLTEPAKPAVYTGTLQYEGEHFDYKSVSEVVKNGYNTGVRNYTGQGYIKLGRLSGVAVKDTITVTESGKYRIYIRYVSDGETDSFVLYVNGEKLSKIPFKKTSTMSTWKQVAIVLELPAGESTFELKASGSPSANVYIDNITVEREAE